ncbi:MAG: hypothetical protein XU11_C0012G0016 [Candidatus Dadabacteria bacterium CSP1-2]|nr:MAG: hypothetical protein XU11_C0012G0016 [Candidatus Dadabacteria bacterium CSP1-2]
MSNQRPLDELLEEYKEDYSIEYCRSSDDSFEEFILHLILKTRMVNRPN